MNSYDERRATYHRMLRELNPGVNEIILHLSGDDNEIRSIIGPDAVHRYNEFLIFNELETHAIIKQRRIRLIGWRDMIRR